MYKKLKIIFFCHFLFWGVFQFSPTEPKASGSVIISDNQVNIREGPGLSYPVVKKANKSEIFSIIKENGDWIQLDLSGGKKGWIANWLVTRNKDMTTNQQTQQAEVNTNDLRIRKGPGTSFQVIGYLNKGVKVQVLETNESWMKISASFGEGWAAKQFLSYTPKQQPSKSVDVIGEGTILTNSLNVRSQPSTSSKILGKLDKSVKVKVYSQTKDWTEISYSNQKAWISSQFIQVTNGKPESNQSSPSTKAGIYGTVTATSLNVRSTASLNGSVVGTITKGQKYKILEEKNNWAKIEIRSNEFGWAANWYLEKSSSETKSSEGQTVKESFVTIVHSGTNIRASANVNSAVVQMANTGETFPIKKLHSDWYEIQLKDGKTGYVAGWIVTVSGQAPQIEKPGAEIHLKNKTIILDPGHGGGDNGTTGTRGTREKDLTIRTASILFDKLKSSGANVILTRNNDTYLSLKSRVSTSHYHQADAFISVHYDSILDRSVHGMTSYYYHNYQKDLAQSLHSAINSQTKLKDRGARFGDYHVLRENKQASVLLELGYLSNPAEEMTVNSKQFQETAASGIFNGLAKYFKEN